MAFGILEFFYIESPGHGDGADRVLGSVARLHFYEDTIEQGGSRSEAALLVIAHEHELLDAAFLRGGEDVAADANPLAVERVDRVGEHFAVKRSADRYVEPQI